MKGGFAISRQRSGSLGFIVMDLTFIVVQENGALITTEAVRASGQNGVRIFYVTAAT